MSWPRSNCGQRRRAIVGSQSADEAGSASKATFTVHLDLVSFNGQPQLNVPMVLHWVPNANANTEIDATIKEIETNRTNAMRAEVEKAFVKQ